MTLRHDVGLASLALAAIVLLVGCGGGSPESNSGPAVTVAPPAGGTAAMGTIVVVAGDDDINDWDQAIFEISRILLLGGSNGQVVILDEKRTIDFLALETVNEVLAEAEVPADSYEKIRFEVDGITLIRLTDPDDPETIEEQAIVAQSSSKVDVNPQSSFTVGERENLVLEVDFALEDSIKAHETGNGTWKFRPVVFARVLTEREPGRLIRVYGNDIDEVSDSTTANDSPNLRFSLCDVEHMAERDRVEDPTKCIRVLVDDSTSVFQTNERNGLERVRAGAIEPGRSAVVYGRVLPGADRLALRAEVVALGALAMNPYTRVECIAGNRLDDETDRLLSFLCKTSRDDAVVEPLEVEPGNVVVIEVNGSKRFDRDGKPVPADAVQPGVEIETEGLERSPETAAARTSLQAFIVFVGEHRAARISGVLAAIDLAERRLLLVPEPTLLENSAPERRLCVAYGDRTTFYKVSESDDAGRIEGGIVTVDELSAGVQVEAKGVWDGDCLAAASIILTSDEGGDR